MLCFDIDLLEMGKLKGRGDWIFLEVTKVLLSLAIYSMVFLSITPFSSYLSEDKLSIMIYERAEYESF